jgi:glycosyltransferase involved in cell wall biosynthesis
MENHLRPEYEKNGTRFDFGTSSSFWRLVVEDCKWADVLLVNSYFVRDTFLEQGFSADKIRVAYLGVRSDFFGLREITTKDLRDRKVKLLFTGGFGFRKGGEYIFGALKILKENLGDVFEMDVVGSYAEAEALIKRYERYNLPITFHGHVPQDDLKEFLANSDIYVFPSLAEGCASSGMEAMAAGLCVVATKESGLPIDDGVNGCVVPSKDAKVLAEKIQMLLETPSEIDRMGASASKLIHENYTWEKYAETVKSIYSEMLGVK